MLTIQFRQFNCLVHGQDSDLLPGIAFFWCRFTATHAVLYGKHYLKPLLFPRFMDNCNATALNALYF